ncbi:hypothetical protein P170DRAFT_509677 [Aspergillus steynii IBT 23096]|uniref:Uncharacterized protein n=1 Tax=Aspergillus steynii IBT 23096 TaxID=1392250 RepID=A0A2I2G830_9EURO|nr:uncharacterized protein P170DRAFT_509677 [Aspergillus steynii IBT 23096]PLB49025.1 hypothetical protein P170DRAFT_509677 [Aspergillus steynii IBT 23096]
MRSPSLSYSRYQRHLHPRGLGPRGIGGLAKVAVVGTCLYFVSKKLFHHHHSHHLPESNALPVSSPVIQHSFPTRANEPSNTPGQ